VHDSLTRPGALGNPLPEAWLILGTGAIASGALILWFPDDVGVKVLAMTIFWLVSIVSVKLDVAHPFFWFGGPFLLYSISGPLLFTLGIHPSEIWGGFLMRELNFGFAMDLQYLSLMASSMVIGPRRLDLGAALRDHGARHFYNGVLPVLALTVILSGFAVSEIIAQGFTRKIDVILYGSWSTRFSFALNMVATSVGVLLVREFVEGKSFRAYLIIAFFVILGLMVVLLVGQRNFLFRLLIVIFFAFHVSYHKISFRSFLVLFVITSPLILILGGFKMAGIEVFSPESYLSTVENIVDLAKFSENPALANDSPPIFYGKFLLFLALRDEFMTAGNNLAMLVSRMPMDIPFQNGMTLVNDLASAMSLGFLGLNPNSSAYTYNALIFPVNTARGGGQGFTLVGTGYMNFGIVGAILIMAAFGGAVRLVYRWAAKSAMGLFFFLGFLPISFSAARNDLSMPVSQSLKHVLLPLAIMLVISYLMGRSSRPVAPDKSPSQ
jgi:O-antigen polysaccharide polymerase Wzy